MPAPDALEQPLALDLFEGPLDLLLTLVLREEVDLLELPLADVVSGALGEAPRGRWDHETAGELVVLLAAVAELKARLLVGEAPEEEPDPDAIEARERLAARLVAYAPFRRAAEWLAGRAAEAGAPRYRRVPLDAAPAEPPRPEDPARLRTALLRLLAAPPAPALGHLTSRRVSLPEAIARLRAALGRGPALSFDAVVQGHGPLEEAVALMAALELARRGEARLHQPVPFGDIAITASR